MAADLRPGTHEVHHARFRSMGSEAHVIVVDGWPSLLSVARRRLGPARGLLEPVHPDQRDQHLQPPRRHPGVGLADTAS